MYGAASPKSGVFSRGLLADSEAGAIDVIDGVLADQCGDLLSDWFARRRRRRRRLPH